MVLGRLPGLDVHPGISAKQLQRQLGIGCHETAWAMLHKLRGAMVSRQSASSKREVEIDEFFLGGYDEGLTGGRQREKKTLGGVAIVELGFDRSYVTFVRQLRLLGLRPRWEACRSGGHGVTVELAHEPSEEISSIGWSFARRRGAGRRTCSSAR